MVFVEVSRSVNSVMTIVTSAILATQVVANRSGRQTLSHAPASLGSNAAIGCYRAFLSGPTD